MTGLNNRLALDEHLQRIWPQSRQRGGPLSILFADVDHFKRYNDAFGHLAGDDALRQIATVLRSTVRAGDFTARYGGEEFVVVAADCDASGALDIARRFHTALHTQPGLSHPVTASVGIASTRNPAATDSHSLLTRADHALYQAKLAGRDAIWCWDENVGAPIADGAGPILKAISA